MNRKANYYGMRGWRGYLHATCLLAFEATYSRYDAQGCLVSRPIIDTMIDQLEPTNKQKCIQCGEPLQAEDNHA